MSKRWAVVMLAVIVLGSSSACGGSSSSTPPDEAAPPDQAAPQGGEDTTGAKAFTMTVSGELEATVTTEDLSEAYGFFCGTFEGQTMDGSPTTIDFYSINFDFDLAGEPWSLIIDVSSGGPGTQTVGDSHFNALLGPQGAGHGDVYEVWEGMGAVTSSGTVTVAEDGQSGSFDLQNLIKLTQDMAGPGVDIEGNWSC